MGNSLAFIRPVLLANQHCCGLIIPTRPDVAWSLCQCVCLSLVTRVKLEFGTDTGPTRTPTRTSSPTSLSGSWNLAHGQTGSTIHSSIVFQK